jgi:hypothetical protein
MSNIVARLVARKEQGERLQALALSNSSTDCADSWIRL